MCIQCLVGSLKPYRKSPEATKLHQKFRSFTGEAPSSPPPNERKDTSLLCSSPHTSSTPGAPAHLNLPVAQSKDLTGLVSTQCHCLSHRQASDRQVVISPLKPPTLPMDSETMWSQLAGVLCKCTQLCAWCPDGCGAWGCVQVCARRVWLKYQSRSKC